MHSRAGYMFCLFAAHFKHVMICCLSANNFDIVYQLQLDENTISLHFFVNFQNTFPFIKMNAIYIFGFVTNADSQLLVQRVI